MHMHHDERIRVVQRGHAGKVVMRGLVHGSHIVAHLATSSDAAQHFFEHFYLHGLLLHATQAQICPRYTRPVASTHIKMLADQAHGPVKGLAQVSPPRLDTEGESRALNAPLHMQRFHAEK